MVAANKLVRKGDRAGPLALGFTEPQITHLLQPDDLDHAGYPDYAIKNSGANIRLTKARIAELPQRAEQEAPFEEIAGDGWQIYAEDNRLCIVLAERTSKKLYTKLRSYGFVWSLTRNDFVRTFSHAAIHWARHIVGTVDS